MSHVPYGVGICNGMYKTKHCTCSGSFEQVYVKTREGTLDTVKRVFKYLCGTTSYGFFYEGRPELDRVVDIHGFVDADWAGDLDRRRSTSGYMFNLFGGAISWMSKIQVVVALSIT
jgi:hypothetical protein